MNKVVHFEIPFDDQTRAKQFYQKVFGWRIEDIPAMNYMVATTTPVDPKTHMPLEAGAINGGFIKREPTAKTPMLVISVDSIDEHFKLIEAAGGKLIEPKVEIGGMGCYARACDSEGNVIGLWETLD